jgi:hypothetical protein
VNKGEDGQPSVTAIDSTGMTYQDGSPNLFGAAGQSTNTALNGAPVYLGGMGSSYHCNAYLYELIVFNRILTAAEYNQVNVYLLQKYRPTATNLVIVRGDSISSITTNNLLSVSGLQTYLGAQWDIRTCAWGGKTLVQDASDDSALSATFDGRHKTNVVIEFLGTNDIFANGVTGAAAYANFAARCQASRAMGYKVIACTMLPRGSAPDESQRQVFNTSIRANWRTFSDYIVDWENAVPTMGQYPSSWSAYTSGTGAVFQGDQIHPTGAGMLLLEKVIANALIAVASKQDDIPAPVNPYQLVMSSTGAGKVAVPQWSTPSGNTALGPSGQFTLGGNGNMQSLTASASRSMVTHEWSFDSNLTDDLVGNSPLNTGIGTITSNIGIFGNCATFNGGNGSILYSSASYALTGGTFSVSFWFKVASNATQIMVAEYEIGETAGQSSGWNVNVQSGGVDLGFQNASGTQTDIITGVAPAVNTWHYVTAEISGSVSTIYCDALPGVSGTAASGVFTSDYSGRSFTVGGCWYGNSLALNDGGVSLTGSVDDVRFYNGAVSAQSHLTAFRAGQGCLSADSMAVSGPLYLSTTSQLIFSGTSYTPKVSGTTLSFSTP